MKITGNTSASTSKTGGRFTGKGLINVGIFTAIYFVVVFAVACLGFIPILMAAICGIIPLIAGIPYMLFLTRARKHEAPHLAIRKIRVLRAIDGIHPPGKLRYDVVALRCAHVPEDALLNQPETRRPHVP